VACQRQARRISFQRSSGSCSQRATDRKKGIMQSSLIDRADHQVHHHDFLLAAMAMKAVHRLRHSEARTEDTLREVLSIVANGKPVDLSSVEPAADDPGAAVPAMRQPEQD
jgi:hypothetical protein